MIPTRTWIVIKAAQAACLFLQHRQSLSQQPKNRRATQWKQPTSLSRKTLELVRDIRSWRGSRSAQPNLGEKTPLSCYSGRHQLKARHRIQTWSQPHGRTAPLPTPRTPLDAKLRLHPRWGNLQFVDSRHDQWLYTKSYNARTHGWIDYSFRNKLCKTCTFRTAQSPSWDFCGFMTDFYFRVRIILWVWFLPICETVSNSIWIYMLFI